MDNCTTYVAMDTHKKQHNVAVLQHCMQRLASLDKQVEELAWRPEYRKVVALLRCFKGIDTLTAMMREYQLQGKSRTA